MTSSLADIPLIPPEVYASRDRGDLVLFCGAGVSVDAGCPTFGELACMVEAEFGPSDELTQAALTAQQFDQYLQLVEQRLDGSASAGQLRKFVARALGATATTTAVHELILKLSRTSKGETRVVTTNFDRHFEKAADNLGLKAILSEHAPRLAPPSKDRWGSIVHLHGGLDGGDLRDLVLTSGDFGRAYITERWASRFVTELFENFDVLFLGYSAEDVVIRYLLDAYAARPEKERGTVWAISSPGPNDDDVRHWAQRWRLRSVKLIEYDPKEQHYGFAAALAEWASMIESHAAGRAAITQILDQGPLNLAVANRRHQLQWLLGDASIDGARALFVERNGKSVPAYVEWLDEFVKLGLLEQRGQREATIDRNRQLLRSQLVGRCSDQLMLSERAFSFASWIADLAVDGDTRPNGRSNSEDLLEWIQRSGREAALHPALADLVLHRMLNDGARLHSELRQAWKLVLDPSVNARLSPPLSDESRWTLESDLAAGHADELIAQRLLGALHPVAIFRRGSAADHAREFFRAFRKGLQAAVIADEAGEGKPRRHDFAQPDIVLRCGEDEAQTLAGELMKSPERDVVLRSIAIGANHLLERALELLAHTQPAFDYGERNQYERVGGLVDHHRKYGWTMLADLTWHAGAELDRVGDRRALSLYEAWLAGRHLTQRRLALHAAAHWINLSTEKRQEALDGEFA